MLIALLLGCVDVALTQSSVCDGVQQPGEHGSVDAPFDADGDGFFDGSNPGCIQTYAADKLDCDDANPDAHPGASEVACNLVDDDCDAATPDGPDLDGDGVDACGDCADADATVSPEVAEVACNSKDDDCDPTTLDFADADGDGSTSCVDCNDASPAAHPGLDEVCDDGLDNDCNGTVDDGCDTDYTGTWNLGSEVKYRCASGAVDIDFTQLTIADAYPSISIRAAGSSQPGNMTGTRTRAGAVNVDRTISGSCDESYSVVGSFTSDTDFSGTFYADFTGAYCGNCVSQTFAVTATR
jgi:hypothetical protein